MEKYMRPEIKIIELDGDIVAQSGGCPPDDCDDSCWTKETTDCTCDGGYFG